MPIGKIKWFSLARHFGFIEPEDGGRDVFVHAKQVERSGLNTLLANQKVEYDLVNREHGKQEAQNLRIVEEEV